MVRFESRVIEHIKRDGHLVRSWLLPTCHQCLPISLSTVWKFIKCHHATRTQNTFFGTKNQKLLNLCALWLIRIGLVRQTSERPGRPSVIKTSVTQQNALIRRHSWSLSGNRSSFFIKLLAFYVVMIALQARSARATGHCKAIGHWIYASSSVLIDWESVEHNALSRRGTTHAFGCKRFFVDRSSVPVGKRVEQQKNHRLIQISICANICLYSWWH